MRTWSLNGRFLAQPLTGVQRYAREIVMALERLLHEGHPLTRDLELDLIVPPDATEDLPLAAITRRVAGRGCGHLWEQFELPQHVKGGLISFCNTGPISVPRQIVCIHDVNTRIVPQSYSWQFRVLYRALIPALGARCARIATVSNFSAGEIVRFGIAPADRIFVGPDGHEHALAWTPRHSGATLRMAGRNTVVTIGSRAPHKNLSLLVGLADRLAAEGLQLAIVGATDPRIFSTAANGVNHSNVQCLGRLSDNELAALLQDSLCLAFPSLTEGFGLPPLEAMAIGCPVIAADRGSLPEICQGAALMAAPDDSEAWLSHIRSLRERPSLRAALIEKGTLAAKKFSWRRSSEIYLEKLAEIDCVSTNARITRARSPASYIPAQSDMGQPVTGRQRH